MRALDLAASVPWAITPEALQQIFEIAARVHEPDFELAAARLAARQREIDVDAVSSMTGKPLQGASRTRMRGKVAVLPVEGPVFRYANLFSEMSGATSIEMMARDLRVALRDSDVEAILLHVDSPGGETNGTGEFADMVYQARGKKPIWAYVSNQGCSAAYWIASACDRVICAPTAMVGSIGVVAAVQDPSKDKSDRVQFVSSQSPNKRPDPNTKDGKDQIQTMVDDLADEFIATVARNRAVTSEDVIEKYGHGGVLIGQKAVDAGLCDAIGSFEKSLIEIGQSQKESRTKVESSAADATVETGDHKEVSHIDPVLEPTITTVTTVKAKKEKRKMSLKDRLIAALAGVSDDDTTESAEDAPVTLNTAVSQAAGTGSFVTLTSAAPLITASTAPAVDPELARVRAELAAERQARQRVEMERISERASAFVDRAVSDGKMLPPTAQALIRLYEQLAIVDSKLGAAQFPDGTSATYISMLENVVAAQPSHLLDQERLPAALQDLVMMRPILNTPGVTKADQPMSAERKKSLLAMTDLGRSHLNGSGN